MGKFLKIILGVVIALVIVVGIALVFVVSNLDRIVKGVIETAGSEVAGVPVTVSSVEISLQEGQGAINGLRIRNPQGFDSDYAIELDRAALALDLQSVGADVIVLKSILVDGAQLNYEQQGRDSNLQAIMDNLEAYTGEDDAETADDGREVKLIIDRFDFVNAAATVSVPALNQTRTAEIPDVKLTAIGRKSSGVSAGEAAKQILKPIMEQSIKAAVGVSMEDVKERAQQEADQAVERAKEKATEKLGDFLRRGKD